MPGSQRDGRREPIQCDVGDILSVLSPEQIAEIVVDRLFQKIVFNKGGNTDSKIVMDRESLVFLAVTTANMARGDWPEDSDAEWILEGAKNAGIIEEYWHAP